MHLLALINPSEVQFTINGIAACCRLIEDTKRGLGDCTLGEEIVYNRGHGVCVRDGACSEIGRSNTQNTVDTVEALGGRSDADRLVLNDEPWGDGHSVGDCTGSS